jgi:type I restriction enzyme S subunit
MTTARLSHVADVRVSTVDKHKVPGEVDVELCNYVDVYKNSDIVDDIHFMWASATLDEIARFTIRSGDTLFTKDSETADDIGVPAFVRPTRPLVCGYHVAIARPRRARIDPRFLYWSLASHATAQQWAIMATGVTRVGLRQSDIGKLSLWLPDLDAQAAISTFIDRETVKIDKLIARQEQLISALAERREARVFTAATNGLGASRSKAVPVRWLGSVPQHWRVGNIRRFAEMKTGHTPSRSRPELWEECTIPWFTLADVWQLRDGRRTLLGDTKEKISRLGLENSAAELLPAGTVVLSRTASVGFSGIMPQPLATSQDFWNWICGPELLPDFLLLVFRAMRREFGALVSGSTHQTIYQPVAAGFTIPVPPLEEQVSIVDFVRRATARTDELTDKAIQVIRSLHERRAALITAAVTGQLDVTTYGR